MASSAPLARLFSARVTGPFAGEEKNTAKRKSFQALVNCQISTTTKAGIASGSAMCQKVRSIPAPSMVADSISSCGTDSK